MGHIALKDNLYTIIIYAFHMPLFFIISGYLSHEQDAPLLVRLKACAVKSAKSLLVPYLLFYLLSWLIQLALKYRFTGMNFHDNFLMPLWGMCLGLGHNTPFSTMVNDPLWFLPALFCTRILGCCLYERRLLVCLPIVAFLLIFRQAATWLPLSLGSALLALPFFYAGQMLKRTGIVRRIARNRLIPYGLAAVCLPVLWLCVAYNGRVDMANISYNNMAMYYAAGMAGSGLVMVAGLWLEPLKNGFIRTISSGTLLIMSLHAVVGIGIGFRIMQSIHPFDKTQVPLATSFAVALIVLAVFYLPIRFCAKYSPILLGKPRRKRNYVTT